MAKASKTPKAPATPVAASSNWKNLQQVSVPYMHAPAVGRRRAALRSRDRIGAHLGNERIHHPYPPHQMLHPAPSPDRSSKKRGRACSPSQISSTTIVASPTIPLNRDSKGKGRATTHDVEDEHDVQRKRYDKKTKGMVPVEDLLQGNVAGWQTDVGQYLAIDCEMVGVGPEGVESALARVSIVNYHGHVTYDSFVKPREKVTDYRTWVSGVRERDLLNGQFSDDKEAQRSAPTFAEVIKKVSELIKGRILIGHAISNDTQVLLLSHPHHLTRDTSKYAPLQALARTKRPSLKTLSKLVLGVDIQSGEHSSIDDARATMAIYRSQKAAWEDALRTKAKPVLVYSTTEPLKAIERQGGIESVPKNGGQKDPTMVRKGMGLAQTLRLVRAQQQFGTRGGAGEDGEGFGEVDQDVLETRQRKKARIEEEDGFVLGFDYTPAPVPVQLTKATTVSSSRDEGAPAKKKIRKVSSGADAKNGGVDSGKRPKSKDGWWED
ncbi:BZ3500_MvSof-1268-A1-R1_Chr1-2g01415 [Microbotryum saponariae]|uniref:RNA exonuclease 4 n=1 Tax=Microbotryum saponariae TaxID=289078 RepID=A0A2X0KW72_9BASI|nr:BZ3500_MvSof-1268-A1-R1_Chr1-2g01415 [Microbotryum saponariae]SCZ97367.1 BZ3501_MvSof-1269-A2-R1_Chr1-2g01014 [Microbotryum saponariae]